MVPGALLLRTEAVPQPAWASDSRFQHRLEGGRFTHKRTPRPASLFSANERFLLKCESSFSYEGRPLPPGHLGRDAALEATGAGAAPRPGPARPRLGKAANVPPPGGRRPLGPRSSHPGAVSPARPSPTKGRGAVGRPRPTPGNPPPLPPCEGRAPDREARCGSVRVRAGPLTNGRRGADPEVPAGEPSGRGTRASRFSRGERRQDPGPVSRRGGSPQRGKPTG